MEEKKKDWLPIILYISIFFGLQIIIGFIYGYLNSFNNGDLNEEKILSLTTILIYTVLFILFIILYHKRLIEDAKRLNKKSIIIMVISLVAVLITNFGLTRLLVSLDIEMANQEAALDLLNNNKIITGITLAIFGPVVEELVYRYSLSTIIKKDITFIIISSILFGMVHGLGIAMVIYIILGVILAICYRKTDNNLITTIIIHIINNTIGVLMAIALLV